MAIDAEILRGQWNELRGKVKERWGQLTDDDLTIQGGDIDQLVGRIQEKTGEGREAIEEFLAGLTAQGASAVAQAAEATRGYAQQAAGQLRAGYDRSAEYAGEGYRRGQDIIRRSPGASLAVGFGIGLAVGLFVGLALRERR